MTLSPSPLALGKNILPPGARSPRKGTMTPSQASVGENNLEEIHKIDDEELIHLSATDGKSGEDAESQTPSSATSPAQSPAQQPGALSNFKAFTTITGATPPSNSPPSPVLAPLASTLISGFHDTVDEMLFGQRSDSLGAPKQPRPSLTSIDGEIDNLSETTIKGFAKAMVKLLHTFESDHQRVQALPLGLLNPPQGGGICRTESQQSISTTTSGHRRNSTSLNTVRKMSIQQAQILHRLSLHQQFQLTVQTHGNSLPATPQRSPYQSTITRANFGSNTALVEKLSPKKESYVSEKKITRHLDYSQNGPDALVELNQYVLVEDLGEGSHSRVYLGFDNTEQEFRAVKEIRRPLQTSDEMKRIRREIHIMKRLRHQNIVTLHEVIDDPTHNKLYLIMQYVEKGPLVKYTKKDKSACEPIEPNQLAYFTRQICAGLHYLHVHGIAHRDVKPENILLGHDEQVFLADFGVSEVFKTLNGITTGVLKEEGNTHRRQSMFSVVSDEASFSSMASPCDFGSITTTMMTPKPGVSDPPIPIQLSSEDHASGNHHAPPVLVQSPVAAAERRAARSLPGLDSASIDSCLPSSTNFLKNAKGTPAFFAPEILRGEVGGSKVAKKALDVWALGVSLYLLLTGELPWRVVKKTQENAKHTTVLKVEDKTSPTSDFDEEMDWQNYTQAIIAGRPVPFPDSIFNPSTVDRTFAFGSSMSVYEKEDLKQHRSVMQRWKRILEGMLDVNPRTRLSLRDVRKLVKQLTELPEDPSESGNVLSSTAGSPRSLANTVAEPRTQSSDDDDDDDGGDGGGTLENTNALSQTDEGNQVLNDMNILASPLVAVIAPVRRRSSAQPASLIESRRQSTTLARRPSVTLLPELLFGQELVSGTIPGQHSKRGSLLYHYASSAQVPSTSQPRPSLPSPSVHEDRDDGKVTAVVESASSPTRLRQEVAANRNRTSFDDNEATSLGGGEREKRDSSAEHSNSSRSSGVHNPRSPSHEVVSPKQIPVDRHHLPSTIVATNTRLLCKLECPLLLPIIIISLLLLLLYFRPCLPISST